MNMVKNDQVCEELENKQIYIKLFYEGVYSVIEHILKYTNLVWAVVERMADGKQGGERPQLAYMRQIIDSAGCGNYVETEEMCTGYKFFKLGLNQKRLDDLIKLGGRLVRENEQLKQSFIFQVDLSLTWPIYLYFCFYLMIQNSYNCILNCHRTSSLKFCPSIIPRASLFPFKTQADCTIILTMLQ